MLIFANVKMSAKIQLILLLQLTTLSLSAEKIATGIKWGVTLSLGTHVQRVGLFAGAYIQASHFQGIAILRPQWMKKKWEQGRRFELQCSEGIYVQSGASSSQPMSLALLHEGSNFSNKPFAIGFHLKHYVDNVHTSQTSGLWSLSYQQATILVENDAFLFSYRDRYRTAAILMMYEWSSTQTQLLGPSLLFGAKFQLYTGDALGKASVRICDSLYPSRHGYWDMSKTKDGKRSQGIAAFLFQTELPYRQSLTLQIGIDDEHIRHLLQNKWIHDMSWLPKRWEHFNNPHIPMLQKNGEAYLFKPQQQIRPAQFYFQLGCNEIELY